MEVSHDVVNMLDLMDPPAFCVKEGTILYVNTAARQRTVAINTNIEELLATGKEEYAAFTDGCLYLSLMISGTPCGASVNRVGDVDIFVLEYDADQEELRAMSLAAEQLRGPLANVVAVVDTLFPVIRDSDDPAVQENLARINKGLFQMHRVLCNMSAATQYPSASPSLTTRDIRAMMEGIFSAAAEQLRHANIELCFTNLPSTIFTLVDEEKLERAIHNILSNAAKFTPKGGTIYARFFRRGRKLYLTVQDNGPGVAPEMRGKLFSRYLRQPGLEDGRFGIGLGLVLVRSVATLHGGTVLMEYPEDAGLRMTMTMDIRQDTRGTLRSPINPPDYAGGRDHLLLELSEVLPASLYKSKLVN